MASPATATADTLINLKVNLNGVTRRFKLPLRDLGAHAFEEKLRSFLQIPNDTPAVIERYSDSATSYVTLNRANIAVYKQLFRAAKAKQKLKLRVTTKPIEPVKATIAPQPVTIEDEPEAGLCAVPEAGAQQEPETAIKDEMPEPLVDVSCPNVEAAPGAVSTVVAPQTGQDFPGFIKQWRAHGNPRIHLRRDADGVEMVDFLGLPTSSEPLVTRESQEASSGPTEAQDNCAGTLADLMREACERELAHVKQREERANTVKEIMARSAARLSKAEPGELPKAVLPALEKKTESNETEAAALQECMKRPFTVCCNSCDRAVPEAHFHCSICDDGDFDLCQDCVDQGISCHGEGHWLIKRTVINGDIKTSSTQIAPKLARPTIVKSELLPTGSSTLSLSTHQSVGPFLSEWTSNYNYNGRTCNCCVQEFREAEFVHCTTCEDYDLCKSCFAKNQHGHHPKHGFTAAVKGTTFDHAISSRLAPGRNVRHNAICDGCDKYVRGIRHKCLDCPDWDYCTDCVKDASFIHPNHRFVTIYEPLADRPCRASMRATHYGISCDGPLCAARKGGPRYIIGERYKCAVCHDTDFCANCEASPANTHNKTHPLIKFKTPVRHVSVTTTGEHEDGQRLPTMGDRCSRSRTATQSSDKPASTTETIAATPVQTVVDLQPTEQATAPSSSRGNRVEVKKEESEPKVVPPAKPLTTSTNGDLVAVFKWDTIQDGSVLPQNHTFEQTWVLRNEGTVPWPAGCAVKFVGGDYMGAVDPTHPTSIHELVSASESTVCYNALNPGQEFPFTVLMRTPDRDGKVISYWRLTTPGGVKFGHKLWCDVNVQAPAKTTQVKTESTNGMVKHEEVQPEFANVIIKHEETTPAAVTQSRMIIPKLEHESPEASVHEDRLEAEAETETDTLAPSADDEDDFEDCGVQDDWAEDSDNGFMTDEEYDILDASDEEFLFEQQKMLSKK